MIIATVLGGCATSYVNIPADGKDTALNAINIPPVPTILESTIAYAVQTYPIEGPFAVQVPDGIWPRTQRDVMRNLEAAGVTPSDIDQAGDQIYSVVRIHVRGSTAETTVVLPPKAGTNRRVLTVKHDGGLFGWPVQIAQLTYGGPSAHWPETMIALPASAQAGVVNHGWDPRLSGGDSELKPVDRALAPVRPASVSTSLDQVP